MKLYIGAVNFYEEDEYIGMMNLEAPIILPQFVSVSFEFIANIHN